MARQRYIEIMETFLRDRHGRSDYSAHPSSTSFRSSRSSERGSDFHRATYAGRLTVIVRAEPDQFRTWTG